MKANHTARLAAALGAARKRLDARYPLAALELLMALPESGALTYAELHSAVPDLSHVALSRHVRLLCGRSKLRQAGSNAWADQRPDPADARKMLVSLTRRGRALQQAVVKVLNAPRPHKSAKRAVRSATQTTRRANVTRRR